MSLSENLDQLDHQTEMYFSGLEASLTDDQRSQLQILTDHFHKRPIVVKFGSDGWDLYNEWSVKVDNLYDQADLLKIPEILIERMKMLYDCQDTLEKQTYFIEGKNSEFYSNWTAREIFMFAIICGNAQDLR